jgi:DNA (cytosine-5)-methyltransferase 1
VKAGAKIRFIDLFCGIGGFRYAFERAGCECVFSSDWNKYAQLTYEANFGEKPHGDIHSVAVADIPKHDILCAGFPCQPFSIAGVSKKLSLGKAHGFDDKEQGNLFFSLAEKADGKVRNHGYPWRLIREEFLEHLFAFQIKLR